MSVLADWAASGLVTLTGRPGGPPLVPPGRAATVARELADQIRTATAGRIRVDGPGLLGERAAFTGLGRRGAVSVGGGCRLLPTDDGWAAVSCVRPDDVALLGALVGQALPTNPWPAVAAWLVEHRGAELAECAELLGIAAAPLGSPATSLRWPDYPPRPVEGLLVVDFSALWAGPLCAHLLGLAGARVIKVETPNRPDGARRGDPDLYRLLHAGHRSVVLDPAQPAGRRAMAALVDAADVVIESSRPRALAGFGLDAHAAVAAGTTWISITAGGRNSNRVGFGDDVAAGAGLVARDEAGPVFCGDAIADPLTGLTAAALALTAPAHGGGVLWDVPMCDVVARTLRPSDDSDGPNCTGGFGEQLAAVARRAGARWELDTPAGSVPVALPRHRSARGSAPESGVDTAAVLTEIGIPVP